MKKLLNFLKLCRIVFLSSFLTYLLHFHEANKEIKENLDSLYGVYKEHKENMLGEKK